MRTSAYRRSVLACKSHHIDLCAAHKHHRQSGSPHRSRREQTPMSARRSCAGRSPARPFGVLICAAHAPGTPSLLADPLLPSPRNAPECLSLTTAPTTLSTLPVARHAHRSCAVVFSRPHPPQTPWLCRLALHSGDTPPTARCAFCSIHSFSSVLKAVGRMQPWPHGLGLAQIFG